MRDPVPNEYGHPTRPEFTLSRQGTRIILDCDGHEVADANFRAMELLGPAQALSTISRIQIAAGTTNTQPQDKGEQDG